jgi:hypothetical protein
LLHDWEEHQGFIYFSKERSKKAKKAVAVRYARQQDTTRRSTECNTPSPSPSPFPSPSPLPKELKDIPPIPLEGELSVNQKIKKPKRPRKAAVFPQYTESFEMFWKEYPKKKDKKDAFDSWTVIGDAKIISATKIIEAVINQKKSGMFDQRENYHFCPNPCVWLNKHRWEDEIQISLPLTQSNPAYKILP